MTAQRKFPNRSHMLKRLYRSTFQRGAIASIMLRTTQYRAYTTRPRQFSIPFMSGNSAPRTKNFARFTRLGLIEDILLVCYSSANMREKRWLLLALYGKYSTYSKHVQNGTRNSIDWKNSNSLRLSTRFSFRTVRTSLKLPIRCAVDKSVLGIFGLSISERNAEDSGRPSIREFRVDVVQGSFTPLFSRSLVRRIDFFPLSFSLSSSSFAIESYTVWKNTTFRIHNGKSDTRDARKSLTERFHEGTGYRCAYQRARFLCPVATR